MPLKIYSSTRVTALVKKTNDPTSSSSASATATSIFKGQNIIETIKEARSNSNAIAFDNAFTSAIKSLKEKNLTTTNISTTVENVITTVNDSTIPWITDETTLKYKDDKYYVIKGFSLTTTEYIASLFATTSYYDFGYYTRYGDINSDSYGTYYQNKTNSGLTLNTYYFMQNIILKIVRTGNGTKESPYSVPQIRIPICADYWLKGTAKYPAINSGSEPYFIDGQTNVQFTELEYQNFVTEFILYCYLTWKANFPDHPITFTIDLHWNYAAQVPLTSGSYLGISRGATPNYSLSSASSKQLPMPGVAKWEMYGGGAGLNLTDNTLEFWNSVSTLFGVKTNENNEVESISSPSAYTYSGASSTTYFTKSTSTTPLPLELLQNIMFELYNEPHADKLTPLGQTYDNKYTVYVNGGEGIYNGTTYNFTGFGQMYNTIRQTVRAQNICIISGSDDYAFMKFNMTNGQWNTDTNTINTGTYNCFTTLRDDITNGKIYKNSTNPKEGCYDAIVPNNILINLHPYIGLYSGGTKHGGYYDDMYTTDDEYATSEIAVAGFAIAGFAQIIDALQGDDTFSMNCPIICTEFGGYDLPWSTFSTTPSSNRLDYTYSEDYKTKSGTSKLIESQSSKYGKPTYNGRYIDLVGNVSFCPGIVGFLYDFKKLNVSFCAWAVRPNSGGNGNISNTDHATTYSADGMVMSDNNPPYYVYLKDLNGWAAIQPDVICGSANSPINILPISDDPTPTETKYPVGFSQMPYNEFTLALIGDNKNQDLSTTNINYGANGADFKYIFDNFYNK
jgi:hypothetical protein